MPLPNYPASDVAFLVALNSGPFNPDSNPSGLADGGHISLWPEAMASISNVAAYHAAVSAYLLTLSTQVSTDAASAAAGSGTEATLANIRAGLSANYLSIRSVYDANAPVALTEAATIAWDMATGINFKVTLAALGRSLANPSNQRAGKSGLILVSQDLTGGRSITSYGSHLIWVGGQPAWPSTANAITVLTYFVLEPGKVIMTAGGSSAA